MANKKQNRLAHETSPYLRQHASNPVDWYPWGEEAFEKSRKEQKLIFLSVGYSACHWCHVMERESFENKQVAAYLNEHFVSIKVDREERPDVDSVYMSAVQLMTQQGGWPMTVFLTPEAEPVYGGTYFPPVDKHGLIAFPKVLERVQTAWASKKQDMIGSAKHFKMAMQQVADVAHVVPGQDVISLRLVDEAVAAIQSNFDPTHGGFGQAPKFFHSMDLRILLRHYRRTQDDKSLEIVTKTLKEMAAGGIYDQLGGGFHRYSTDEKWLVPHFEKMLYDNALLIQLYLEAYKVCGDEEFKLVAEHSLDYVLREMVSEDGAFYSTQDADSEGIEGKYFIWEKSEIDKILGPDSEEFCDAYLVTDMGNWEGGSILHRVSGNLETLKSEKLKACREKLLTERAKRLAPGTDTKILVAWNGMMVETMAFAYQALGERKYLEAAQTSAAFILDHMSAIEKDGSVSEGTFLLHSYKDGRARFNAYLDDYAMFASGLLTLFQADFDERWLLASKALVDRMLSHFWDGDRTNFFYTPKDHERLIVRTKEVHDGATPSSNSMAVMAILRLARMMGSQELIEKGEAILDSFVSLMKQAPASMGQFLIDADFLLHRPSELIIIGGSSSKDNERVLQMLRDTFLPSSVVIYREGDAPSIEPLKNMLGDKKAIKGEVTLYFCEKFTCQVPAASVEDIERLLRKI